METVTAVGLLRRRTPTARLRYWRTKHDTEVDFVWVEGETLWPVEVRYQRNPGFPRGLRAFLKKFHPPRALVVTRDTLREERWNRTRVQWLPASLVL